MEVSLAVNETLRQRWFDSIMAHPKVCLFQYGDAPTETVFSPSSSTVEHLPCNQEMSGSIPTSGSLT